MSTRRSRTVRIVRRRSSFIPVFLMYAVYVPGSGVLRQPFPRWEPVFYQKKDAERFARSQNAHTLAKVKVRRVAVHRGMVEGPWPTKTGRVRKP